MTKRQINRRNLLKAGMAGLGFGALAGLLNGRSARGDGAKSQRRLVIALAYGGWDPVWVMDPKPDATDGGQIPGVVKNYGNLPVLDDASRPNVTSFFEQWGSQTTIVNGIAVESLAHETCIDVVLSGQAGADAPDLAARTAHAIGQSKALPYLALSPNAGKLTRKRSISLNFRKYPKLSSSQRAIHRSW